MHIYGPAQLHGSQSIGAPHTSRVPGRSAPAQPASIQDQLDISETAQLVDQARDLPEVRQDRIDAIRAQIQLGTYETDEKLETALGRLLNEIG